MAGDEKKADENKVTERTQLSAPQDVVDTIWKNFASHNAGFIRRLLKPSDDASSENTSKEEDEGSYTAARKACIEEVTSIVRECQRRNSMFTDPDFYIALDFLNEGNERACLFSLPNPPGQGKTKFRDDGLLACAKTSQTHPASPTEVPLSGGLCNGSCDPESRGTFSSLPKTIRRVHDIFDNPTFAPHAPRTYLPPLHYGPTVGRWCPSPQGCVKWSGVAKLWLQATMVVLSVLRLFNLVSLSTFFVGISLCGLLVAVCLAAREIAKRLLGPNFASCHIEQGNIGDCWWMSAIAALCSRSDLLRKVCVAWDQDCGVYGFVFYRDGAWIHTVVDDCLYLTDKDYISSKEAKLNNDSFSGRTTFQRGSSALHFAKCVNSDYIWLPLLQKAYAKVHGDYQALISGYAKEGMVDITGGIGEGIPTEDTKDRERLWQELYKMHEENPWGGKNGRWQGDWGIGSRKWDLISMWWLQPHGIEDGVFYMTFEAVLEIFCGISRITVFDESIWTTRQHWVSMNVSWEPQFNPVYFELHLTEDSKTALSLSQLDDRYFKALRGRYIFHLDFGIKKKGSQGTDFLARSSPANVHIKYSQRATSIQTDLKRGTYEILVKVTALERDSGDGAKWSAEDVLKQTKRRPLKLQQAARSYDQAYGKLKVIEPKIQQREEEEESSKSKEPKKQKDEASANDHFVYPDPGMVAWNAICGVGLRVFSKDPDMRLEVHHRNDGKVSEPKKPAEAASAPKKEEEKTQETWKITIEGVARREKEDGSDTRNSRDVEDRGDKDGTASGDEKNDKDKSPQE
ncbi:hypothetical protein PRZ48_007267 [Zasmidium cellare]|uniref:Calpain catalytic domain-containing protein n=1 Tax=Zasmidium cellare TaxID=395010 RepID=A0ABR0EKY8_ZASCE|nr:hypothetical protein PRZ48_007267 [Zasmidium cellare]